MCKSNRTLQATPVHEAAGWTLSELLISLALMAVLTAIALPAYNTQQSQARRIDAQSALQQLQLDQVRWRGTHESYASDLNSLGWASENSPAGHYRIAIADASADGFTLTATPLGAQARDTICNPMRLQHLHTASVVLSSGADLSTDTGRCWRQ
ncbi:prepilin-type cleavage/methylation domain-containing protein [Limnohabitans sp. 2KL-1]|jgi:type IV pilus assembly protein PilE|uniref:type IV pilin protein n=1 Tax=Limnohabitans sp. 2KL-1 TaxID=1100699 RepID=UPI000D3DA92C|nr:type IV pilin protein [Limnohabitans sp. 2KL-1]PUE46189.1 prepilin-type cleavage/methylation domain-containing protein [Limnohabitans sp. 2KL-1]